ncbi:MAG: VWA domain-containing protein [Flavobacteriales bacterium]|nr:MAG: VWA domain-containing protein [Flavobacteriales bacterium]
MFLDFFYLLKKEGLHVSLQEYLSLLESLNKGLISNSVNDFYYLCRSIFVKHESQLDRFDKLFGHHFKGLEYIPDDFLSKIPKEWLEKNFERMFSDEDRKKIEAMGGLDQLMERFKELMKQQKERHEGGNRWIGTGGTSPFGAYGYNPEGFRMGQEGGRMRSAIKVWDKREFANLDDDVELNTRNIKLALKRLRHFTREGVADELDLDKTISNTSKNAGILDIQMVASKQNRVKVLLFLDAGGSMDGHIYSCSQLFSAAKHEFKHLEYFYFHNCLYESVWQDNQRRHSERIPTMEILNKFNKDYKVIMMGDAAMAPSEIVYEGGSIEHFNDEAGVVWLKRLKEHFPHIAWINPMSEDSWSYFKSTKIIKEIFDDRMFPMTIDGITKTMKCLKHKKNLANV